MRDAKSWLILAVAVGAVGVWAGCSGKRISTVGNRDTGTGGASEQPASCADEAKGAGETDIDCGGAECASCPVGASCEKHRDCESRVCRAGSCKAPTCTDGVANGDESDVDCGGVGVRLPGQPDDPELPAPSSACPRCDTGQACQVAADCSSGSCTNGSCAAATCTDSIQNGAESDVDCGGPSCARCTDAKHCKAAVDCASGMCAGGRCVSCEDGLLNGSETDVDCGGGACDKCAVDAICYEAEDCQSGECWAWVSGNHCFEVHCGNDVKDADESDKDCGGLDCQACGPGEPHCGNGIKDADETDEDCGGTDCQPCASG